MSTRSVIVRLEAEVSQFTAGMGRAAASTDDVASRMAGTRQSVADNEQAMKDLGGTFLKFGALGVAALGATAKAAMDWEAAWAGVTKTVDGSADEMDMLEKGLRGLAKTLPATHTEIAGVAEAAGQLGVSRKDVVGFTKTMIDLSETTNLSSDEAATSIAQISNVMGTMAREGAMGVQRFGATLVALGNDGASTEKEIVAMAARLSGAMKLVGGSEADLLAMANAMASVGIEAQLGGGVMSRVMQRMYADVQTGGEGLDNLARVAGVSSKEFATAFETDPVRAVDTMIKGLSRVKESGGNVIETMKDLGIKGTEETSVILRLAGAGDLLTDSLDLGAKAWEENTALAAEAEKRYATTEAKIQIAWNKIKDAAIDAGGVILPLLAGLGDMVGGLASAFGGLPAPAQSALTIIAGVATAAALMGGALLVTIPKIAATRLAMQTLSTSGSRIPGVMGKIGKGAGIAMVGIVALGAALKLGGAIWGEEALDVEKFGQALTAAGGNAEAVNELFADTEHGINGVGDAALRLSEANWGDDLWSGILDTLDMDDSVTRMRDSLQSLDTTMAGLVQSGSTEKAGKNFATLFEETSKAAEAQGKTALTTRELLDLMPEYEAQLNAAATAAGVKLTSDELLNFALGKMPPAMTAATTGLEVMQKGVEETGVSIDAVVEDMDKFLEGLFQLGLATMSSRDANVAFNESIRNVLPTMEEIINSGGAMGAMLNETGTDFDLTTEAGSKANGAFQDIARNGMAEVEAMAKEGLGQDALQGKLTGTYESLIVAAGQLGITGTAAEDLARKVLGVPDGVEIASWMDGQAKGMAEQTKVAVDAVDGSVATVTTKFVSLFEQKGTPYRDDMNAAGDIRNGPAADPRSWIPGFGKAGGGEIDGPGTGISDSVNIRASKGEHMFTAAEVDLMGGQQAVYKFRSDLKRNGGLAGHAAGGEIGSTSARSLVAAAPQRIDYDRMAQAGGDRYTFVVPDKITAEQYFDEAQYRARVNNRGGRK